MSGRAVGGKGEDYAALVPRVDAVASSDLVYPGLSVWCSPGAPLKMSPPPKSRRGCRGQWPRRGWLVCRVRRRQITATAARSTRLVVPTFKTPLKSPLSKGDVVFLERGAARGGMKNSSEIRVARQWPKRKALFRRVCDIPCRRLQKR